MVDPISSLGLGLGIGTGYSILSEYARLGILWAKWKGLPYNMKISKIAEAMQSLLDAEKNEVSGLSSKGAVEAIYSFIDKTLDFAWMVDEGIATQMFVQMIQQSIAYAIHSSHAGSIGTIGNVYSGSMYLSPMESTSIGEFSHYTDRELKAFLSAEVGQNIPSLAFNLVRGANRQIDDVYRSAMRNVDSILDEWNDLALSYYRHYHSMTRERFADAIKMKETATDRAYGLLEQVANEHLARISEQLDTLEGAKAWFDATLLTEEELKMIAIRINLEKEASEANYDEYKTDITDAIDDTIAEWDTKITQALGDMTDNETKYNVVLRSMLDHIFADVVDFANTIVYECDKAVEDVCAYRNVTKSVNIVEFEAVPPIPVLYPYLAFKDIKILKPEEQSHTVINLPPYGKQYKLIHTESVGKPLFTFKGVPYSGIVSFLVNRAVLQVELKTFLFNAYVDVYVVLSKRAGIVGEIIDFDPRDDPSYLIEVLDEAWEDVMYELCGDYLFEYVPAFKDLTEDDTIYAQIWLGCRNQTVAPVSGTVNCKNLKVGFNCGHLKIA